MKYVQIKKYNTEHIIYKIINIYIMLTFGISLTQKFQYGSHNFSNRECPPLLYE